MSCIKPNKKNAGKVNAIKKAKEIYFEACQEQEQSHYEELMDLE